MRWVAVFTIIAVTVVCARAALLQGADQQPIVDSWTKTHPLGGRYVVLLRDAERAPLPTSIRIVADEHHGDLRLVVTQDQNEAELRAAFPGALAISPDRAVSADAVWNLDRLDERALADTDGSWTGPTNGGSPVHIYIVDSGVDVDHPDFGGRADNLFSAFATTNDQCGHGTHVAGVAGGFSHGVARGAPIHAVKVLSGAECAGTLSTLARGLLAAANHASGKRAVINLSLGFNGYESTLGVLIGQLVAAGHIVVAAAGNDAISACVHYPSSYPGVIAVAATDDTDSAAGFSNYGSCVDLYAPGVDVESAQAYSSDYTALSGTSMSTPHVVGIAALLWQENPGMSGAQIAAMILSTATQGVVTGRRGSPDLLGFWSPGGASQHSTTSGSSGSSSSSSSSGSSSSGSSSSGSSSSTGSATQTHCSLALIVTTLCAFILLQ